MYFNCTVYLFLRHSHCRMTVICLILMRQFLPGAKKLSVMLIYANESWTDAGKWLICNSHCDTGTGKYTNSEKLLILIIL